jgi:cysteine desulfurase
LRDRLIGGLVALPDVQLTGHSTDRLPNSASVVIPGVEGGDLVAALDLDGIEASTGSACTTGSVEPSHVLLAMGIDPHLAHGSLRLTLGPETTEADVDRTLDVVEAAVQRLRAASGRHLKPVGPA